MSFLTSLRLMVRRLLPYGLLFLVANTLIRLFLTIVAHKSLSGTDYVLPFFTGFWYDLVVVLIAAPVFMVFPLLLPKTWAGGNFDRSVGFIAFAVLAFMMIFQACGEYFFWDEFTTRFNFIAVDYLIYTQEVLGNILESYPVYPLLGLAFAVGLAIAYFARKKLFAGFEILPPFFHRLGVFVGCLAVATSAYFVTGAKLADTFANANAKELGSNGVYNFVHAFFNNEIEFKKFYPTLDDAKANAIVKAQYANDGISVTTPGASVVERKIVRDGPMQRKNVIQITMESLSFRFMTEGGNTQGLTPVLDQLSTEGLFLSNMRATGTRTVRGLEAVSLSVPPTPGQSILRRQGSDDLSTIGGVLMDRGYEAKFLYGGHGFFDNMNGFFVSNGYTKHDKGDMPEGIIHFSNAWGVADEDLYDFTILEADKSFATGKNFYSIVMNTTNHRPFTYPAGKIDPALSGRDGAVRYTDYAIGKFLEKVATKPWFKDTIFVFVADHTDSVAGKAELDFDKYHIPCIIWAPGFIKPQRIDTMTSQIDVVPTILGLMNTSYLSRFYGIDVLHSQTPSSVFVSNYEKVAMVKGTAITVLEPIGQTRQFVDGVRVDAASLDRDFIDKTIAIYQVASGWRTATKRINSIIPD